MSSEGDILFEDHNRVSGGDHTRHPEFEIARWAANHLSPEERKSATVYTSGEHCPMCAAAHGWVGLGRIVYASSSEQLGKWLSDMGVPQSPVKSLPIQQIIENADVDGPVDELAEKVHVLHLKLHEKINIFLNNSPQYSKDVEGIFIFKKSTCVIIPHHL